ncbi:MAG: hypothetical protein ACYC05_01770 [Sulfuricella sp.]
MTIDLQNRQNLSSPSRIFASILQVRQAASLMMIAPLLGRLALVTGRQLQFEQGEGARVGHHHSGRPFSQITVCSTRDAQKALHVPDVCCDQIVFKKAVRLVFPWRVRGLANQADTGLMHRRRWLLFNSMYYHSNRLFLI